MEIERKGVAKAFLLTGCYLDTPPLRPIAWRPCHASRLSGAWVGLRGYHEDGQWIVYVG